MHTNIQNSTTTAIGFVPETVEAPKPKEQATADRYVGTGGISRNKLICVGILGATAAMSLLPKALAFNVCEQDDQQIAGRCGAAALAAIACGMPVGVWIACGGALFATHSCSLALAQACMHACIDPTSTWCSAA